MGTELKMETKTYHKVEYYDLEEYIQVVVGQEYEILPNEECSNDTSKNYSITGFESDYDKKFKLPDWEKFKQTGEGGYLLNTILNGLAEDGHIPKGEYIINICW